MARKRRKRMGRPPKPVDQVKSEWLAFVVEPARAQLYQKITAEKFASFSDFARAACDALAEHLGYPKLPPPDEPPKR